MTYMPTRELPAMHAFVDPNGQAVSSFWRLIRVVRKYFRDQEQYRHLEQLPDYLLDDVGLTRADIKRHTLFTTALTRV